MDDSFSQKIEFAAIVVYSTVSAAILVTLQLIEDLGTRHIDHISIRGTVQTRPPNGRTMISRQCSSQLERETIAERIRDNMHELSSDRTLAGGMTPQLATTLRKASCPA